VHQLWTTAHIITGPIDASDYKTHIFPILFFKRINDVYNEEDNMGRAYEILIKKFADKANKKAGEFYTPRTVVRLMIEENDFNLNIARYVQKPLEEETITVGNNFRHSL